MILRLRLAISDFYMTIRLIHTHMMQLNLSTLKIKTNRMCTYDVDRGHLLATGALNASPADSLNNELKPQQATSQSIGWCARYGVLYSFSA